MTEFGPNGEVLGDASAPLRPYQGSVSEKPKVKRVGLAVFLCAFVSCLLVALGGFLGMALVDSLELPRSGSFGKGLETAVIICAFNWFVFFITIPVSALALGLSIGRFPRRRIVKSAAYYRWGATWGAILVAGTTSAFGLTSGPAGGLGGLIVGLVIGIPSGLACAGLFLAIVKPRQQLGSTAVDVF